MISPGGSGRGYFPEIAGQPDLVNPLAILFSARHADHRAGEVADGGERIAAKQGTFNTRSAGCSHYDSERMNFFADIL